LAEIFASLEGKSDSPCDHLGNLAAAGEDRHADGSCLSNGFGDVRGRHAWKGTRQGANKHRADFRDVAPVDERILLVKGDLVAECCCQ